MPQHASPRAFRATAPASETTERPAVSVRRGILPPPPPPSGDAGEETIRRDSVDDAREHTIPAPPPDNEVVTHSYFRTMRSPPPAAEPEPSELPEPVTQRDLTSVE
jgi:hypothetical protein